jgi:hypothetical protein
MFKIFGMMNLATGKPLKSGSDNVIVIFDPHNAGIGIKTA